MGYRDAYDVACEAVAFATFMDDDDNNAVERAMRKMKRLRLACNGNGDDVIEWKKHERCARLALGRCVEWMVKEYAGKEERKVVRLGVHAVRVLAKYADAGNIPNLMATNTIEILIAVGAVEEVKGKKWS